MQCQLSEHVSQLVAVEPGICPGVPGLNVAEALAAVRRDAEGTFNRTGFPPLVGSY